MADLVLQRGKENASSEQSLLTKGHAQQICRGWGEQDASSATEHMYFQKQSW